MRELFLGSFQLQFLLFLSVIPLILGLYWIMSDPRPVEERIRTYLNPRHIVYYLADIFVFLLLVYMTIQYPQFSFPETPLGVAVGISIYIVGVVLLVWAKLTMGKNWGMPAQHDIKRQDALVTSGPFMITRNPIYLGIILVSFGYFVALRSYLVFIVLFEFIYIYKVVLKEEVLLRHHFKKQYEEYCLRVPRFLGHKLV